METLVAAKPMVDNSFFRAQKADSLAGLVEADIDAPIIGMVNNLNRLPFCFTLQCCYGHFLYPGQDDAHSLLPLPQASDLIHVEYRIAYLAFYVEISDQGRRFLAKLQDITKVDPHNIQFGCAEWFWERQVNSYVLQVEPDRWKYLDRAQLDYQEALRLEKIRERFFDCLRELLKKPNH